MGNLYLSTSKMEQLSTHNKMLENQIAQQINSSSKAQGKLPSQPENPRERKAVHLRSGKVVGDESEKKSEVEKKEKEDEKEKCVEGEKYERKDDSKEEKKDELSEMKVRVGDPIGALQATFTFSIKI